MNVEVKVMLRPRNQRHQKRCCPSCLSACLTKWVKRSGQPISRSWVKTLPKIEGKGLRQSGARGRAGCGAVPEVDRVTQGRNEGCAEVQEKQGQGTAAVPGPGEETEAVPGQRQKRSSLTEAAAYFQAAHLSALTPQQQQRANLLRIRSVCMCACTCCCGSSSLARITHF